MQKGQCLCEGVTVTVTGDPINIRICHCRLCQKAMGTPFFARALFKHSDITLIGETERHPSSPELDRLFCPKCGTTIAAWRKTKDVAGIALAIFEDRNAFAPNEHIWVSEKMDWVDICDDLPQYPRGKT